MTKAEGGQHIGAWQPLLRLNDMATASSLAPAAESYHSFWRKSYKSLGESS